MIANERPQGMSLGPVAVALALVFLAAALLLFVGGFGWLQR